MISFMIMMLNCVMVAFISLKANLDPFTLILVACMTNILMASYHLVRSEDD
jgi:hypothetical protein